MRGCSYLAGFLYAETPNHLPGARSLGVSAADFSDQPDLLGGFQKSLLFLGMGVGGETGKKPRQRWMTYFEWRPVTKWVDVSRLSEQETL